MSDQLIDQIADEQAITQQKGFVDGVLDDIFNKFKSISDLKIKLSTDNSFQQAADTVSKVKKTQDDLSLSVVQYNKLLDQTAQNQAKVSANTSQAAKDNASAKVALQQQNQELTATAKLLATANFSVGEAIALVNQLKIARNAISIVDDASRQKVADLNKQIDLNNKFINENTSSIEQQKNNVGNYIGAVSILKGALEEVNQKIEANKQAGLENTAVQQQLVKEQQLLNAAVGRQVEGFSSLAIELRTNQQLLATMAQAGLGGTKAFEELREKVNEAQKGYSEFREQQKLLGSETGGFEAIIKGAEGLVGVYGAVVSAGKLFGKNNEELEQGMQKLEAVIALLNSLQGIERALHEGTAIAVTIESAAKKGLVAVTELYTFVTEAASTATKAFRATLAATGIGAVILLLASFVNELLKATAGTLEAVEAQGKYNDALKEYYNILAKNNEAFLKYQGVEREELQKELDLLTAQGAGFRELQAVKAAIAAEDAKNAVSGLKNLGLANESIDDQAAAVVNAKSTVESLRDEYDRLGKELQGYETIRAEAARKAAAAGDDPDKDRGVLRANAFIKSLQASREELLAQIEPGEKLVEQYEKSAAALKILAAEQQKYNDEQAANLVLNTEKTKLDAVIAANAAIVADDRNTEAKRVQAIKDGAAAQIALEEAQAARLRATPGRSKEQKIIDAQNTAAAIQKIEIDAAKQTLDLTRAYDLTDYNARLDLLKQEAQDSINKDQVVIDNEKNGYAARLAANTDLYNQQRAIATANYFAQLHDKTLSDDQRKDEEAKYNSTILTLDIAFTKTRRDIFQQNAAQILADGIAAGEQQIANIKTRYAQAQVAINNARISGALTEKQYQQALIKTTADYEQQQLQVEITNAYLKVNATQVGTKARADAEQELADKVKELSDSQVKSVQDSEAKKQKAVQDTVDKIKNQYDSVTGVIGKALDAQITAEKNQLQEQINNVNAKKDADIAAENATTDIAADKADKIAVINAQAQAQDEALQQKQKQLDIEKAKFDKIKAIGDIILNTAVAVSKDLADPAKIPFDIALGAAELAIAIAAPVPTYEHGTDYHPGGPAIVGDGGRSELIQLPDGSMYITPNKDTFLDDMPAGSVVYPDAQKMLAEMPANVLYSLSSKQDDGLQRVFQKEIKKLIQAVNDKEELHINPNFSSIMAIHQYGSRHVQYIAENIQFK